MKIFRRKEGGLIVSLPFRRRCFCSPPRGGRLFPSSWEITVVLISTHAPAWGGDRPVRRRWKTCPPYFYSRPAWGATVAPIPSGQTGLISTHAPRVGGDTKPRTSSAPTSNFYSRPRVGGDGNFSQAPGRCVIQIAEKYTAIQISCPFVHAIFEKLCR